MFSEEKVCTAQQDQIYLKIIQNLHGDHYEIVKITKQIESGTFLVY